MGTAADAACETTVSRVVQVVNEAYLDGEDGLWNDGMFSRTDRLEVQGLLKGQKLLLAVAGSKIAGSLSIDVMAEDGVGEIGMLNVSRDFRRQGIALGLIAAAEAQCLEKGCSRIRLHLLTPQQGTHPFKVMLDRWYTGLGYAKGNPQDFGALYPELQPILARACDLVEYNKALP